MKNMIGTKLKPNAPKHNKKLTINVQNIFFI